MLQHSLDHKEDFGSAWEGSAVDVPPGLELLLGFCVEGELNDEPRVPAGGEAS